MPKKVVVFAGAGASKAVNSEHFPTTLEFFERLPEKIKADPLFQIVTGYLARSDGKRQIDIEEVLWELQELRAFSDAYRAQSSLIGYGLNKNRFLHLSYQPQQNQSLGALDAVINGSGQRADKLIGEINAIVYDLYSFEPSQVDLSDNWLYLLERLSSINCYFNVFTTNYDLVVESAVAMRGNPKLDDFAGLSGVVSKRLNLDLWKSPKSARPLLTKLHGSVNWKFGQNGIQVGDSVYTGDHKKQAIIYPGFKGTSESEFFSPLHDFMGDRFEDTDAAIFIGFAFRDGYINEMISERLPYGCPVYVINPSPVRFPLRRAKAMHVKSGFNRDSVDQIFADLGKRREFRLV
jgi:SIR2-like domain